jgi:hypothetical protein
MSVLYEFKLIGKDVDTNCPAPLNDGSGRHPHVAGIGGKEGYCAGSVKNRGRPGSSSRPGFLVQLQPK